MVKSQLDSDPNIIKWQEPGGKNLAVFTRINLHFFVNFDKEKNPNFPDPDLVNVIYKYAFVAPSLSYK